MHENAKWNFHVDHGSRKVSRVIGVLYSPKTNILFIRSLSYNVLPHFNYCLMVWGSSNQLDKVYSPQK